MRDLFNKNLLTGGRSRVVARMTSSMKQQSGEYNVVETCRIKKNSIIFVRTIFNNANTDRK